MTIGSGDNQISAPLLGEGDKPVAGAPVGLDEHVCGFDVVAAKVTDNVSGRMECGGARFLGNYGYGHFAGSFEQWKGIKHGAAGLARVLPSYNDAICS